jgi:integrase
VDLESAWWTIPAEHTKNGQLHRVPLTSTVVELIKAQQRDDDAGSADYVFAGASGVALLHRAKKAPSVIAGTLKIDFRGHDLRRTAATGMAAAGVPREHIGHVLNHVEGGARATRVYDRYAYDREKRIALESWERRLNLILERQQPNPNVVAFTNASR